MKPILKLILIISLAQVTACSYFFPDKEKDYVYSKQIAALEIPPDLQAEKTHIALDNASVPTPLVLNSTIEFFKDDLGAYLRINAPFAHVWRVVGKALTARSIEVTDKNRQLATYYVQYDPELQKVEDGTFWAEVLFFFASDVHQEKPYHIFLTEIEQGTDVFVQDEQGNNLSSGDGEKLLTLLYDTIKKDFED